MASDFIIEVSEADFEYQVLEYSENVPVVVDFWAEWCGPCKYLGPVLEKLAKEAHGTFRLAKVNVDENPKLAIRYGVHGIPAVKAFKDRQMVSEFVGTIPEPRIREFLRNIAPHKIDLKLEKANSLLEGRQFKAAEEIYREVLSEEPVSSAALLGLAKCLLFQGRGRESVGVLSNFPASKDYYSAQLLLPLAQMIEQFQAELMPMPNQPLEAAFQNTLRLVQKGNVEAAMDGLLDILRENKQFRDGAARQMMVALLELLGENDPSTQQYRSELASALF